MAKARPCSPGVAGDAGSQALLQIGQRLREARLARGEELREVAAYLRIRPEFLEALEAGDPSATPGRPYAKGFLRSYADHLTLDSDRLVALGWPGPNGMPSAGAPAHRAAAHGRSPLTPAATMLAALLLAGTCWVGYRAAAPDRDGTPALVGPPPAVGALGATDWAAEPATRWSGTVDAASAVAAEPGLLALLVSVDGEGTTISSAPATGSRVTLVGRSTGWLRLHSADRTFVRSGTLRAGERLDVPLRQPDLRLTLGDAAAVELLVDGRSVGPAGPAGAVVRDLALAPDALRAWTAGPR